MIEFVVFGLAVWGLLKLVFDKPELRSRATPETISLPVLGLLAVPAVVLGVIGWLCMSLGL